MSLSHQVAALTNRILHLPAQCSLVFCCQLPRCGINKGSSSASYSFLTSDSNHRWETLTARLPLMGTCCETTTVLIVASYEDTVVRSKQKPGGKLQQTLTQPRRKLHCGAGTGCRSTHPDLQGWMTAPSCWYNEGSAASASDSFFFFFFLKCIWTLSTKINQYNITLSKHSVAQFKQRKKNSRTADGKRKAAALGQRVQHGGI